MSQLPPIETPEAHLLFQLLPDPQQHPTMAHYHQLWIDYERAARDADQTPLPIRIDWLVNYLIRGIQQQPPGWAESLVLILECAHRHAGYPSLLPRARFALARARQTMQKRRSSTGWHTATAPIRTRCTGSSWPIGPSPLSGRADTFQLQVH